MMKKIIKTVKSVSKKVPKVKIPKPKLPSRTVTKGRSGKLYETDSYAKEGLKQAIETRNAAAGDFTAIDRMLKKPTITDQEIAFISNESRDDEIWVVNHDGSNIRRLTSTNEAYKKIN